MTTKHVLITGTTSGIGLGLLEHFARKGVRITAVNRRVDRAWSTPYPQVASQCLDVRDAAAIKNLIWALAKAGELPDLFILNAGINRLDNDSALNLEQFREVLETNFLGVLNFVAPLTELKAWPHRIKVVAISSVTNYIGNPYCLSYYISKKALTESFEIFAAMYCKTNLRFQWVVLGPVPSGIYATSENFPKIMVRIKEIFTVSLDRAVHVIAEFSQSDRRRLIFPMRAYFLVQGMRLLRFLIPGFYRGKKTLGGQERGVGQPESPEKQRKEAVSNEQR